jgi:hypothetical protein
MRRDERDLGTCEVWMEQLVTAFIAEVESVVCCISLISF